MRASHTHLLELLRESLLLLSPFLQGVASVCVHVCVCEVCVLCEEFVQYVRYACSTHAPS